MTAPSALLGAGVMPNNAAPAGVIRQPLWVRAAKPRSVNPRAAAIEIQPTQPPPCLAERLRSASS